MLVPRVDEADANSEQAWRCCAGVREVRDRTLEPVPRARTALVARPLVRRDQH